MSNQIEQIRAEVERLINNPRLDKEHNPAYKAGLRDLRQFIDALPAQPVPADVQEAAKAYSASVSNGRNFRDLETGYAAGMLAERERLASCPTFKCWIARDRCGDLYAYRERPERSGDEWSASCLFFIDGLFPSIRWEDEPKPVRVIIEEIKEK